MLVSCYSMSLFYHGLLSKWFHWQCLKSLRWTTQTAQSYACDTISHDVIEPKVEPRSPQTTSVLRNQGLQPGSNDDIDGPNPSKSNLWRKQTTNRVIYSCWVRDTRGCKHLILFKMIPMANAMQGQPSTPGARSQTTYFTTIMLCSDQINFTLDVHLFHDFDHRRCTNRSKPTLCQRDISTTPWHRQRHKTSHLAAIRCVCPWTLLPLERWTSRGREGRILEDKEETNTFTLIFQWCIYWIYWHLDCFLEGFGMFWTLFDCCWERFVLQWIGWVWQLTSKRGYFTVTSKTQMDQVLKNILNISTGKNGTSSCLQRWRFSKLCQILL